MSATHKINTPATSLVTRTLDSVDRGHARAAALVHDARNVVRAKLEAGLDRVETVVGLARKRLAGADAATADAIIRAQGVVGQAIEKARLSRTQQLAS